MPKYKLYRLYFHFITFQITTNALVLAQPSTPLAFVYWGVEMISSKVFVFNSFLIAV